MGQLTEIEIFDRMTGCLRSAIDCCLSLAVAQRRGELYDRLRRNLRLAGNCCRQAATWREDARWLNFDKLLTECHKRAGDWLRGHKDENGQRVMYAKAEINELFVKLAQKLADLHNLAVSTKDAATKRAGMILPVVRHETRTQGRAVGVELPAGMARRDSGLIVPVEATLH